MAHWKLYSDRRPQAGSSILLTFLEIMKLFDVGANLMILKASQDSYCRLGGIHKHGALHLKNGILISMKLSLEARTHSILTIEEYLTRGYCAGHAAPCTL